MLVNFLVFWSILEDHNTLVITENIQHHLCFLVHLTRLFCLLQGKEIATVVTTALDLVVTTRLIFHCLLHSSSRSLYWFDVCTMHHTAMCRWPTRCTVLINNFYSTVFSCCTRFEQFTCPSSGALLDILYPTVWYSHAGESSCYAVVGKSLLVHAY